MPVDTGSQSKTAVEEWRVDVDAETVMSEDPADYGDELYGDDDGTELNFQDDVTNVRIAPDIRVGDVCREVQLVLQEQAEMAQRIVVSSLRREYVRGRATVDPVIGVKPVTNQRKVVIGSYIEAADWKVPDLISRLRLGRVITRLGAVPGLGKTTRMPGYIAKTCGIRVCQLELGAHISVDAKERQRDEFQIPVSDRRWVREKRAYLASITYADFAGIVRSKGRKRLFEDFDLFWFDEAHEPTADVRCALEYFAVYSQPHNSLVVASATVSTEESNNVASKKVGSFKQQEVDLDVALESGKLLDKYAEDRMMLIVGSDQKVWKAKEYFDGCQVLTLDSASTVYDYKQTSRLLAGDSMVPRIVVVHHTYGTSSNIPASKVITQGKRLDLDWTSEGSLVEKMVACSESEITQHKARAGRGLAVGSGGVVMTLERAPAEVLRHSERVKFYLGLIAADIKPSAQYDDVAALMPKGLSRDVAVRVLSVALPPMLVLRYLGRDGNVAAMFHNAMTLFTQPDSYLVPSRDVTPIGYDKWQNETIGGYGEGDESSSTIQVKVPFASPASLKVVMHTLYAVSQNWMEMFRWRPANLPLDEDSDVEAPRPTVARRKVVPRLIVDTVDVAPPVPPKEESWAFDVPVEEQARRKKRFARDWISSPDGVRAARVLLSAVEKGGSEFGKMMHADVNRRDEGDKEFVAISSPGGHEVIRVPSALYITLVSGQPMSKYQYAGLMKSAAKCVKGFAGSVVFDGWGPPWISVLSSMCDDDVLRYVARKGMVHTATQLMSELYDRFRAETFHVVSTSHVYTSWWEKVSGMKPSVTRLIREMSKGKVSIAQSTTFVDRVTEIKQQHGYACLALERNGWFVPTQVTAGQRKLPLRDKTRAVGVVDDDVEKMPDGIRRRLHN